MTLRIKFRTTYLRDPNLFYLEHNAPEVEELGSIPRSVGLPRPPKKKDGTASTLLTQKKIAFGPNKKGYKISYYWKQKICNTAIFQNVPNLCDIHSCLKCTFRKE